MNKDYAANLETTRKFNTKMNFLKFINKKQHIDAVKISNPRFFQSLYVNPMRDKYFEKFAAMNQQWFDPDEFLNKHSRSNFWKWIRNFLNK